MQTQEPSPAPTEHPTLPPTHTPTEHPTTLPPTTNKPSFAPTHTPTEHPTHAPSHTPTEEPTVKPIVCRVKEGAVCDFPFAYGGKQHSKCILDNSDSPWCRTKTYTGMVLPARPSACLPACPPARPPECLHARIWAHYCMLCPHTHHCLCTNACTCPHTGLGSYNPWGHCLDTPSCKGEGDKGD